MPSGTVRRALASNKEVYVGPVIFETARLFAREWTADDLEDMVTLVSDHEVTRFLGSWAADPRPEAADFISRQMIMQAGWGWCRWALQLREPPAFELAGVVGFSGPGCPPFLPGEIEVGWTLRKELWGHGIATEIGSAAVDYCFSVVGLDRLVCCVDEGNGASLCVAEKVGFRRTNTLTWEGASLVRHELRNPLPQPPRDPRFRRSCEGAPLPAKYRPDFRPPPAAETA
jgi:RimJ/RimL family protein N-acetyltransferase